MQVWEKYSFLTSQFTILKPFILNPHYSILNFQILTLNSQIYL